MLAANIPTRIAIPFAAQANPANITVIPPNTALPGRASFTIGFSEVNFQPLSTGGIPPFGQDMNGVLNAITNWLNWENAGGAVGYDSAFSSTNGGYPKGALLAAATAPGWWLSLQDDNTVNPDSGPSSQWLLVSFDQVNAGNPNGVLTGVQSSATSPPTFAWDSASGTWYYCSATGTTWLPVTPLVPVNAIITGNTANYIAGDNGKVRVRANSGVAMNDSLPTVGSVEDGWHIKAVNADGTATLTITAPGSTEMNGTVGGSINLRPGQATEIEADPSGNFWVTVQPIPNVLSSQAIYVTASGTYAPGVYDIDTRAGGFTFQLEAGGVVGDNYQIRDVGGALSYNNCIINPNGRTIDGVSGNMNLDVSWINFLASQQTGNWSQS